jgi:hypothetical protein
MSVIHFNCSSCQHPLEADKAMVGSLVDCPSCGIPLEVPSAAQVVARKSLETKVAYDASTKCTNDLLRTLNSEMVDVKRMIRLFYVVFATQLIVSFVLFAIGVAMWILRS